LKILPQQIQAIVDLICQLQEHGGADYLDLLNAIVKVEGLGLTLKRNQAYVMKYVMQDYNKLAGIMDQPREDREQILTLPASWTSRARTANRSSRCRHHGPAT